MEQEGVNIAGLVFETCPLWAPRVDGRLISTLMLLPTKDLTRFEQPGIMPRKFETCPDWGANLNGCPSSLARLFWLDASQGLVGCQLEFFDLTLNEIPDLGLQRRLGDSPHLEGERD